MSDLAPETNAQPSAFERALARYLFALERMHTEPDESNEANDYITDALVQAENAVMFEPANDFDQLRVKADILFCDLDSTPPTRHVLAFFADLVRLTGDKPSPSFNAERWLSRFVRCGGEWVVKAGTPWIMWPEDGRCDDLLAELKARGGKPAVMNLIRSLAAKEA
ncbi:hypothetical protein NJ75_03713 [Novosphingobium subterraneum]|uniref:Uncharacterized protein n=1 Tax=Novosphingobium subterraneum TaxID=48936 RepID=A0A0B8ZAZ2_9SPHN|nr:hypothetical protein NJ75_03713 [Novosphingobium subterraneum]